MKRVPPTTVAWTLLAFLVKAGFPDATKIHPDLSTILAANGKADVIVTFRDGVRSTLDSATEVRYDNRGIKNTAIKAALVDNSDKSQAGVLQTLSSRSGEGSDFQYYKQYWISNKILVKEASSAIVDQLSEDPEVETIYELPLLKFPENEVPSSETTTRSETDDFEWGIQKIQAPEAWAELGGSRGEGIVVGIIDSGVRATHEALRDNFRGVEYGWYDPEFRKPEPYDEYGHGTHVTGTLAGSHGIGVAPGVEWIHCRLCYSYTGCNGGEAFDCMQWMACPTLPDGSNEDCSKAPHVVSNSWTLYVLEEDLLTWQKLGIIAVFAIGNYGYTCQNAYPGISPLVIGVGSTDESDLVDDTSSTGPGENDVIKPDVVAPGVDVLSSVNDADDSYTRYSGTSMSTPHVAGVLALLKVRDPDLTYEQAYEILTQSCDIIPFKVACRNENEEIPNNYFGYGRVNALKAVQAQTLILNSRKK